MIVGDQWSVKGCFGESLASFAGRLLGWKGHGEAAEQVDEWSAICESQWKRVNVASVSYSVVCDI